MKLKQPHFVALLNRTISREKKKKDLLTHLVFWFHFVTFFHNTLI